MKNEKKCKRDEWVGKMLRYKRPGDIIAKLVEYETFSANPELAFGVIRKLNTKNKVKFIHVMEFLQRHPAWGQCKQEIGCEQQPTEFFTLVAESDWGTKNEVKITYTISGRVNVVYETTQGAKAEMVNLSAEMVQYGTDSRVFVAATMGGSMIRAKLMKDGTTVDRAANDDRNIRRKVIWGKVLDNRQERRNRGNWGQNSRYRNRGPDLSDIRHRVGSGETFSLEDLGALMSSGGLSKLTEEHRTKRPKKTKAKPINASRGSKGRKK